MKITTHLKNSSRNLSCLLENSNENNNITEMQEKEIDFHYSLINSANIETGSNTASRMITEVKQW